DAVSLDSTKYPRSLSDDGEIEYVKSSDWTSGFFPGTLWYMYAYTKDKQWESMARKWNTSIEKEKSNVSTHDLGFMFSCSFGNGYHLTGDTTYKEILIDAAKSLVSRYNPKIKSIKSWDFVRNNWQFPVIIDNMMNLELLFWATKNTGDSTYYQAAYNHA